MKLKKEKSVFIAISILSSVLLLIFYSYSNYGISLSNIQIKQDLSFFADDNKEIVLNENLMKDDVIKENIREKENMREKESEDKIINNFRVRTNRYWIVNRHSLQYSAYAIHKGDKIKIVSLIFMNLGRNGEIKCLISDSKLEKYIKLPIIHDVEILPPLHKVTCELEANAFDFENDFLVAIIYEDDFDFNLKSSEINYKESPKLSHEAIQFHRARKFNADKPKMQSIAHCVHMFHGTGDLNSHFMHRFSNWAEIIRNLGYDKVRIYVLKLENNVTEFLNKKYKGFINFVDHPTTFEPICGDIQKLHDSNVSSPLYKALLKNCIYAFDKVFSPIEGGPHDRVCMNDCFLNFKYEYELLTSYDVDEIIFPRLNWMDDLKKFENFDCNMDFKKYEPKYNLYEYGIKLLDLFGRNNIACLMFKHVAFLPNGPELESFMNEISKKIEKNSSGTVVYKEKKQRSTVTHAISSADLKQAKYVLKYHKLNSCLKNLYIKDTVVTEEHQRYLAVLFNSRWGKSIIETNLTETLNHHSCDTFTHGIKFDTPLTLGYASHFRTEIYGFLQTGRIFPFSNVFTDVEYYLFLCKIFGKQ